MDHQRGSAEQAAPIWSEGSWAALVARAASLQERLAAAAAGAVLLDSEPLADERLARWQQFVAFDDPVSFERRIAWDGLERSAVRRALAGVLPDAAKSRPSWLDTLKAMLSEAASPRQVWPATALPFLDAERPLPFEQILTPYVRVAVQRLRSSIEPAALPALISDTALATLARRLLQRLSSLCAPALELEFSLRRAAGRSSFQRRFAQPQMSTSNEQYNSFVQGLLDDGLARFFQEYPVLARLAATAVDRWVETTVELLQRLRADLPLLAASFEPAAAPGEVIAIGTAVSDLHNGGRSVVALRFRSGLRLIYKPKDLRLEAAFFELLAWINAQGAPLPLKTLRVLVRENYGWVEFVEPLPCANGEEAQRYYQRAGALLCLIYVLGGSDCHRENLIACGEDPVLVDLETVMQPGPCPESADTAEATPGAGRLAAHSVLATGLLPWWLSGADGRRVDLSGLGGVGEQESVDEGPLWEEINSDAMRLRRGCRTAAGGQNTVWLYGEALAPDAYVEAITAGFTELYRLLLERREALLAPDGPMAAFADCQVRFVFRDTRLYARLLAAALEPQHLRDGAEFSIQLDFLSRPLLAEPEQRRFWPLRRAEQAALEQGDIPFFSLSAGGTSLALPGGASVARCFLEPCIDRALARLRTIDEEDRLRQVQFVRAAFYARSARATDAAVTRPRAGRREDGPGAGQPLTRAVLEAEALSLAKELREQALLAPDGSASWIGIAPLPGSEHVQFQPLGFDWYGGVPGIALFLAAVERLGGSSFGALALGALQPLRRELRRRPRVLAESLGIGAAGGCAGLVYALLRTGKLLDDATLVEDALRVSALITPSRIAADRRFDVLLGCAGAVLALVALFEATGDAGALERARGCGRHLLANADGDAGRRTWRTLDERRLSGFSHGAAGIAYALLRLYEQTEDPSFQEAAAEAIAYEDSLFSAEVANWPDRRAFRDGRTGPSYMNTWCHGAAGIALARLGGLAGLDNAEVRRDLEIGLRACQAPEESSVDGLCCGSMGRAEILHSAGRRLARPELVDAARAQTDAAVRRAQVAARYRLLEGLPEGIYSPGLFKGTAGIGYTLLHFAHPDVLPSVLLWE